VSKSSTANLPLVAIDDDILYERDEIHHEPEKVVGKLLTFIYDVPYLDGCGIFPPFHILNQIFATGSVGGGMGPGATWAPFSIDATTYTQLIAQISATDPLSLGSKSRFNDVQFVEDRSLESVQSWFSWMQAACEKHRNCYHRKLAESKKSPD